MDGVLEASKMAEGGVFCFWSLLAGGIIGELSTGFGERNRLLTVGLCCVVEQVLRVMSVSVACVLAMDCFASLVMSSAIPWLRWGGSWMRA